MTNELELQIDAAFPEGLVVARIVEPAVPMPEHCLFQLAPDDRVVLRLYADGSVEFGEGVTPGAAATQFWTFVRLLAQLDGRPA